MRERVGRRRLSRGNSIAELKFGTLDAVIGERGGIVVIVRSHYNVDIGPLESGGRSTRQDTHAFGAGLARSGTDLAKDSDTPVLLKGIDGPTGEDGTDLGGADGGVQGSGDIGFGGRVLLGGPDESAPSIEVVGDEGVEG